MEDSRCPYLSRHKLLSSRLLPKSTQQPEQRTAAMKKKGGSSESGSSDACQLRRRRRSRTTRPREKETRRHRWCVAQAKPAAGVALRPEFGKKLQRMLQIRQPAGVSPRLFRLYFSKLKRRLITRSHLGEISLLMHLRSFNTFATRDKYAKKRPRCATSCLQEISVPNHPASLSY